MVQALRDDLSERSEQGPFVLVALSLGGMVALRWACLHPHEIAGCVLVNSSVRGLAPFWQRLRLASAWRRNPSSIVAAQYAGRVGVPAIFPRWCFRELNELRGDRGAQGLLQRHVDRVVRLAMPSAELDIDRPEDLLALEVATQVKRQQLGDS